MNGNNPFARFEKQGTVLLTTFRRDGRLVRTPVSLALVDGHAVFRTWDTAWKARRLAHTDRITLAPSTAKGRPTGPKIRATARQVMGAEALAAAHALRRKHPILHGVLVPLAHRVRGYTTIYFRVDPSPEDREHENRLSDRDRSE